MPVAILESIDLRDLSTVSVGALACLCTRFRLSGMRVADCWNVESHHMHFEPQRVQMHFRFPLNTVAGLLLPVSALFSITYSAKAGEATSALTETVIVSASRVE
jgi:hypothetical protein